jgi:hypothetical protein
MYAMEKQWDPIRVTGWSWHPLIFQGLLPEMTQGDNTEGMKESKQLMSESTWHVLCFPCAFLLEGSMKAASGSSIQVSSHTLSPGGHDGEPHGLITIKLSISSWVQASAN